MTVRCSCPQFLLISFFGIQQYSKLKCKIYIVLDHFCSDTSKLQLLLENFLDNNFSKQLEECSCILVLGKYIRIEVNYLLAVKNSKIIIWQIYFASINNVNLLPDELMMIITAESFSAAAH